MSEATLTPKQEAFAQKYLELGNASEAYRLAYDAENMKPESVHRKAKELLDNGKVAARIKALQEIHFKRHVVTIDSLTEEYEEVRIHAMADKQYAPANAAIGGKAKLHGFGADKHEIKAEVEVKDTSMTELARKLAFVLRAGAEAQ